MKVSLLKASAIAATLLLCDGPLATAQQVDPFQGQILQNSDGTLWVDTGGQRYLLTVASATDDQINSIPIAGSAVQLDRLFASQSVSAPPSPPASTQPAPAPAPAPAPPPPPSVLPLLASSRFTNNGLTLVPTGSDVFDHYGPFDLPAPAMTFIVSNDSTDVMNFQFDTSAFSLKLSDGTTYNGQPGNHVLTQFNPGDQTRFDAIFGQGHDWEKFTQRLTSPQVSWYEISVHNFAPRLSDATWHKDVQH